ncbi:kinase-like domain-containing protein [Cadophora sp. MPI-SDFR-AT-0126]|nr:kinase-like domain-containing protein [Leotiomycetes sp. MPI-SDFR-AT-0126]
MPSSFQAPSMEENQDIFFEMIRDEIHEGTEQGRNPDVRFITKRTLSKIWTISCLERLCRICRMTDPDGISVNETVRHLKEQLLRTISILVHINWPHWDRFRRIFFDRRYSNDVLRIDKNIKGYTQAQLEAEGFLAKPRYAIEFLRVRDSFFPILIKNGMVKIFRKGRILPFIKQGNDSVELGSGGFGTVTKEIIAKNQFRVDVKNKTTYDDPYDVARKEFEQAADFQKEVENLVSLRKASSTHGRIATFLAIISIGNHFNILSDVALMDLEEFLEGRHTEFEVTQESLMGELALIADALRWLHDGIYIPKSGDSKPDERKKSGLKFCCHMDIKPENILIHSRGESHFKSVGEWKISDFGISRIKDSPRRSTTTYQPEIVSTLEHLAVPDLLLGDLTGKLTPGNHTGAQRPSGTWTAPEVHRGAKAVGRESDIWSFGCVFVLVCSLALGPLEIQKLQSKRGKTAAGYNYDAARGDSFYETKGKDLVLNSHIDSWLKSLPGRCEHRKDFLNNCYHLAYSTLAIDPTKRLNALQLHQALDTIFDPPMDTVSADSGFTSPSSKVSSNIAKASSPLQQSRTNGTDQDCLTQVSSAIVEPNSAPAFIPELDANVDSPYRQNCDGMPTIQQTLERPNDIEGNSMAKRNKGKEIWTSNIRIVDNTDTLDDISPPLSATEVKDVQNFGDLPLFIIRDLDAPGPSKTRFSHGWQHRTSSIILHDNSSIASPLPSHDSNMQSVDHESQHKSLFPTSPAEEEFALRSSSTLPNGDTSSIVPENNGREILFDRDVTMKAPRRQTVPGQIRSARPTHLNEMKTSPASLSGPRRPPTAFESSSQSSFQRVTRANSIMTNQASLNYSGILSRNNSSSRQSIPPQTLIPTAMPIHRLDSGQPFQSIIPSNCEVVAFLSSQYIYIYPLHGDRDIRDRRLFQAPAGCNWTSVSLSGPYMLARAQVKSNRLARAYKIQSKSPGCFEINEIESTSDVDYEEGVISPSGYMMFQKQTEVLLRHVEYVPGNLL